MKCGECKARVRWKWVGPRGRHEARCARCGTRYLRPRARSILSLLVYGGAFLPLVVAVYWSVLTRPRPPLLTSWLPVFLVLGLAAPWAVQQCFAMRWPLVRRLTPHECEHCGYDTRGVNTETCPECGKAWGR